MLEANNTSQLIDALSRLDIAVPRRSEGRTTNHTERYAVAHMLSALLDSDRLTYPLNLTQRDRPDFVLSMGALQIGIEHTEAISENEAHKTFLREKGYGSEVHFISRKIPGEPKRQAKQLIDEIERNDAGDGWVGNSVEREWAAAMFHFVERKVEKLLNRGFERYDQDWLLIYDNWSLPAVDRHEAAPLLFGLVSNSSVLGNFERIFVLTGRHLCEISGDGFRIYDTADLWN